MGMQNAERKTTPGLDGERLPDPARIKRDANRADVTPEMWILVCLLISAMACLAQRPEDQVLAVYKQMEKAEQTGDADTFIGLWARESASNAEKMRGMIRVRPNAHYTSSKVFAQGDAAALLGQIGPAQFLSMRLIKEEGRWKIKDQVWSDKAFPPDSVYALVPPAAGAFERAGSPWQNAAAGFDLAGAAKRGWQVRAACDESYLYVRIESSTPLPTPGTAAETPPSGWPVMKLGVSGVGEFVLHAGANIADQATFDERGRANTHRHYVAYWLMLERADQMIFQSWAALDPNPLLQVGEGFFEVRVPLRTMGVFDPARTKITIGDAQWPKSALFSMEARQYR